MDTLEKKTLATDSILKEFEDDIGEVDKDLDDLEGALENLDNLQRKSNIKIRGLKENIEGG